MYKLCNDLRIIPKDWVITEKKSTYHRHMLCGKISREEKSKVKVPETRGGRVEKNHLIAREDEDFFWKNPRRILRCTEFSVIESFTKIILSVFKLKAELCVVGQQGIFTLQTDLITSKFLTQ